MDEIVPTERNVPQDDDWGTIGHVQTLVLMMVTVLGIYLCYKMALPFLAVVAWALTLAVLFTPLQNWLEAKFKRTGLAALISIFLIGLIVVIPALFVGQQLVIQAVKGSQIVEQKINSGEWRRSLEAQPQLAPIVDKVEKYVDLPGTLKSFTTWLGGVAGAIVKGSVYQVLGICLIFYMLFFFIRDRHLAIGAIKALSPLSDNEMDYMIQRVGDTIHATVYGTFAIAAVQGLLGGLMFWWLDLPAPFLWGLVMSLLAIVPMLGASVIWAPAALFLALDGNTGSALMLTIWGVLVVSTIDNLLRPVFVGNRLKLHTVLAFMSVVGGLLVFGAAGLILGPVTLTITITLLDIWAKRTSVKTTNE
ncbi:MAG TPA: AI-2E family transporter [Methylophilaceae bacterium]|nr:AI-2E family transporter [Methylophilaceae bacterium]